jgi:hypothetical protein
MAEDDRSGRGLEIAEPEIALLQESASAATCPLLAVLEQVRSALDGERAAAPAFFAELVALPPEVALERIRRESRFQTWGLCELLLATSTELAAVDPDAADPVAPDSVVAATAAHFAALALAGAERLDPSRHAVAVVADLKARAWAAVGDARLHAADLAGGEVALRAAATCLSHGTGDLLVEARLLEFEAAVRRGQGRYKEAAAVLKLAAARYRETGEAERLERALAEREEILHAGMR